MRETLQKPSASHTGRSSAAAKPRVPSPAPTREDHPLLLIQRTAGNQAVQRILSAALIQPRLSISAPGDVYEQEAARMADAVMSASSAGLAAGVKPASPPAIQRMCHECEEESQLHRKESGTVGPEVGTAVQSEIAGLDGGEPLSAASRSFFEPPFGQDFSSVRIHTGGRAARLADSINAHAFTLGNRIVFSSGKYSPETAHGRHLLAHELTHVVQQNGIARAIQRQSASEYTFGEIGSWGIVSLRDFTAPDGLGNAKASIGSVCTPNTCRHVSGATATEPGNQHSWQNIVAASGTDQSGGGTHMCVGTEQCEFVHQCTRCHGTTRETVERTAAGGSNLTATGTAAVAGHGTLYFYSDPLQGWCNSADRQSGCHPHPQPHPHH